MGPLLLLLLATAGAGAGVARGGGELTRREEGDLFTVTDTECGPASCAEHGAGERESCVCACPQRAPLYREDRELCVDDLPECALATFGSGSAVQRLPFVYLPLKGQIIHPSKEINFLGVQTPVCAVSGAQFLTRTGFQDLRNTLDADVPFGLFRDEGRTFLQWRGEDSLRAAMSGRAVVVRLLCRELRAPPLDLRAVFAPCVAFRVQGTPPRHNVSEVQFQSPNAQISQDTSSSNLSVSEYVAIGISSLLLGLIYVASVLLYLHIRKRKKTASDDDSARKFKGLKKKDGSIITERDIIRISNERVQSLPSMGQDDGVVKKNPLHSMSRDYNETRNGFPSDSGSTISDSEDVCDSSGRSDDTMYHNQTTSAIVHFHAGAGAVGCAGGAGGAAQDALERLPAAHVAVVDCADDDIARPLGTTRRKLYFNPAYFEPELMAEPPPAALEFLTKIREVIAIAKHKMAAKRFQPVLNQIPEEESYPSTRNSIDLYQGSQRSESVISLKRENSRKKSCVGCPGCKSDSSNEINNLRKYEFPSCNNCKNKGDKQHSIRKWLENIPIGKQQLFYNDFTNSQSSLVHSLQSLPTPDNRCKIKKQHSFSNPMYLTDNFSVPKKASTMSVRSEPGLRSYNLPLPEFNDKQEQNFNNFCPTISRVDDIRPIGLRESHPGSFRGNDIVNLRKNKFITNKNTLPDMVNEAIALDHSTKVYNQSSSDDERITTSKNQHCKPPYKRTTESPACNDYETDSLERTSNKKGKHTPTDYEVPSSQASPSLSAALPLEEELTMRNAVYKSQSNTPSPQRELQSNQNHYEVISNDQKNTTEKINTNLTDSDTTRTDYSLVSEVYVNNYNFGSAPTSPSGSECSMGSRKLNLNNNLEKPGCLTIEVKDPPENYIKIHESDGFEPDTLDRKHQKHKAMIENIQFSRKDLLKNINKETNIVNRIQLRSSGTFTRTDNKVEYSAKFNSLRNDYELRNVCDRPRISPTTFNATCRRSEPNETWNSNAEWDTEEGRILTLELRHSKRQRQSTPPTIKQMKSLARPDILPPLPPTEENIYEQPAFPPRRVGSELSLDSSKNLNGRSLSPRTFSNHTTEPTSLQNSKYTSNGPSTSPGRASVQSTSSEYMNIENRIKNTSNNGPNLSIDTNTFVKRKLDTQKRPRRKKGSIEDSGYLSSDSTISHLVQRKAVIAKLVSCSESDDSENDARSESGAESVETHSVYFGSYVTPQININSAQSHKARTIRDCNKNV